MAGLGDPAGEVNITKGAGKMGIIQGVRIFKSTCALELNLLPKRFLATHPVPLMKLQMHG